mgnify:CR=1 FL=1
MKKIIKKILKHYGWKLIKTNIKRPKEHPYPKPDEIECRYMLESSGILHLGAHRGTEAAVYDWFNKKVLWVEAIPFIFEELTDNIRKHYNQKAICAVVGDKDNNEVDFYISNSDGSCSSIFDFSENVKNRTLWGDRKFKMNSVLKLKMKKIDTLFIENKIDASQYNHWVMDLQGGELLALKGAANSIKFCKSISIEISKKEYYYGGAQWIDVKKFLENEKFKLLKEPRHDHTEVLFAKVR